MISPFIIGLLPVEAGQGTDRDVGRLVVMADPHYPRVQHVVNRQQRNSL
jgi:hypothetical protein